MNKKVVFHIDDIGSSIEANDTSIELFNKNIIKSWSVMVPWLAFKDAISKFNKKNIDLWVHLTLTSERWEWYSQTKPTLPKYKSQSLVNKYWYFHSTIEDVLNYWDTKEIKNELINQIEILKDYGINPTHIDSHMGTLLHKKLFHIYKEIAQIFNIQPLISYPKPHYKEGNWFYGCKNDVKELQKMWFYIFDEISTDSIDNKKVLNYNLHCYDRLRRIKTWTTYFLLHVLNTPKNTISPDSDIRYLEYIFFSSNSFNNYINELNIIPTTI